MSEIGGNSYLPLDQDPLCSSEPDQFDLYSDPGELNYSPASSEDLGDLSYIYDEPAEPNQSVEPEISITYADTYEEVPITDEDYLLSIPWDTGAPLSSRVETYASAAALPHEPWTPSHDSWVAGPAGDAVYYTLVGVDIITYVSPFKWPVALAACGNTADAVPPDPALPDLVDDDGDGAELCRPKPGQSDNVCREYVAELSDTIDFEEDCDDDDPLTFPDADEICDGIDNNCDGIIDTDAVDAPPWYLDEDGDTFGVEELVINACEQLKPNDYVEEYGDCDDNNPDYNPNAEEICGNAIDEDCDGYAPACDDVDVDGDGYNNDVDCNDSNPLTFPGAEEICDGEDNSCNGLVDDLDPAFTPLYFYTPDADEDGFSSTDLSLEIGSCSPTAPEGFGVDYSDCDDSDPYINITAQEICDGIDNNCSTLIDEADPNLNGDYLYTPDVDGDGYADLYGTAQDFCSATAPAGFSSIATDCNDDPIADPNAPFVYPGAEEICEDGIDNDCDGTDLLCDAIDADGDGDPSIADGGTDCDDADANNFPANTEVCDLQDNDCDLAIDEGVELPFWLDADGDTYGDVANQSYACTLPAGYSENFDDCNDDSSDPLAAFTYPGATELCDGVDNDCDGTIDNGTTIRYYLDADLDGFGDAANYVDASCGAPSGYVLDNTDCNDDPLDPDAYFINPNTVWFYDGDGDGEGDAAVYSAATCTAPTDYVLNDIDCDDSDYELNSYTPWYLDGDGDGIGDGAATLQCLAPNNHVRGDGDCDDGDASVYPGAVEVCDFIDGDCDGDNDIVEGLTTTYYDDLDEDGEADLYDIVGEELCGPQPGYSAVPGSDCDDIDPLVYTGADEWCDGIDYDCDGAVYETDSQDALPWYADGDGDGVGTGTASYYCAGHEPAGVVATTGDCNDGDASVYPGATEVCNGIDEDCDGDVDEGLLGTYYDDLDGDGYGDPAYAYSLCPDDAVAMGLVLDNTDCNDDPLDPDVDAYYVNPGMTEACNNGIDDNCDGTFPECDPEDLSLASADRTWEGTTASGKLGTAVAYLGDLNADGYGDYALGRPYSTNGDVLVLYSSPTGSDGTYASLSGAAATDAFGFAISSAGDQTGDGVPDFLVGAPGVSTTYADEGAATLYSGATLASVATVTGVNYDASTGYSVANAGDVDGDGNDDLLVGAPGYMWVSPTQAYGAAGLFLGPVTGSIAIDNADALIVGDTVDDMAGEGLAGGDVNGDGLSDILVGASNNPDNGTQAGKAALFYGPVTGSLTLNSADAIFRGGVAGDLLGFSASMAGDVDGDGNNEVLLCAPKDSTFDTYSGACFLFFGPVTGEYDLLTDYDAKYIGESIRAHTGKSAKLEDTNGDGLADIAIGASAETIAPYHGPYIGGYYVFFGSPLISGDIYVTSADAMLEGENQGDHTGWSLDLGDVTGNGFADLIGGAPNSDRATTSGGAAFLTFYGW